MKAKCPKDPSHQTFFTVAHVAEDWKVDGEGNFLEVVEGTGETTHGPHPENHWSCATCGATAKVTE